MNAAASSNSSSNMKYPPTYYLNSRMLPSHINRTVRLFGRVVQVSPDATRVQLEACDGGIVSVIRSMGSEALESKFICVTGVVQADLTVRESVSEPLGESFSKKNCVRWGRWCITSLDMENFNKVLGFMEKSPRMFSVL